MYEKLPEQLKKDGRFCLWKYEERNGRMTKVPYQTNGRKVSSADKNTFSDFRLAVNAMDGYDGIGMGAFDDFCMVDIDHCVFGGKMTQMAEDIVERMDSYTEFSPSGTGVRIVCKASSLSYDTGRYYINNQKLGLEIYAAGVTKKFCTLTGNVIRNRGVEERNTEIGEILETYMLRPISKKKTMYRIFPAVICPMIPWSAWHRIPDRAKSSKPCGMEKYWKENPTAMRICRLQVSLHSGVAVTQGRWTDCSENRD